MRPLAKTALCVGVGYCIAKTVRGIWVAPGLSIVVAILLLVVAKLNGDSWLEVARGGFSMACIFGMIWLGGLAFFGRPILAMVIAFILLIPAVNIDDYLSVREGKWQYVVPNEPVHEATVATVNAATTHGIISIGTVIGALIPLVAWGLIALYRAWNRHRQYDRQLEAFNFALRYEPGARFTCEPPKRPVRKPRAKAQAPDTAYRPAPVYQAPVRQVAVYEPPVHQPGWLTQGRREAGLG